MKKNIFVVSALISFVVLFGSCEMATTDIPTGETENTDTEFLNSYVAPPAGSVNLATTYGTASISISNIPAALGPKAITPSYLNDGNTNTYGKITVWGNNGANSSGGYSQVMLDQARHVDQITIFNLRMAPAGGSASVSYTTDGTNWTNLQTGIAQGTAGSYYSYSYDIDQDIIGIRVTFKISITGTYGNYEYEVGEIQAFQKP